MSDAYDLRSNIKGKPGSQGTLFHVKDRGLLNPQQRWPHGYTPERLNAVRDAVKGTTFRTFTSDYDVPVHKWGDLDREHFAKTVAPSTMHADDLRGINSVDAKVEARNEAEYVPAKRRIGWDTTKEGSDRNLVHEIGHHVDNMRSSDPDTFEGTTQSLVAPVAQRHAEADWEARGKTGEPNSTALTNAVARVRPGLGEAYADNYYVEHYRARGRKGRQPTQGRYEDIQGDDLEHGWPGYRDLRPAPHMGPQFHQGTLF